MDKNLTTTEKELSLTLKEYAKSYIKMVKSLDSEVEKLEKVHIDFPVKFIEDEKYDDLVLKAANFKHKGIALLRKATGAASACKVDYDYLEAQIMLHSADNFLSDKFSKITDKLRTSYVNSKKEMRSIKKASEQLKSLVMILDKMVKAFESDEVNFRRFHQVEINRKGL